MAATSVTVALEGLDELRSLVERLERAVEKIDRPIYGDVHVHTRPQGIDGVER